MKMKKMSEKREEAFQDIREKSQVEPDIGMILGSGLGDLSQEIENADIIDYDHISHFPTSTVEGHSGELVLGDLAGSKVVAMNGRVHIYEGYSMKEVAFPVWAMYELGIEKLLITNAAGGLNYSFKPGDLMIVTDHLNFMGGNPLIGRNDDEVGPRFPAMTEAHPQDMIDLAREAASEMDLRIMEGVYAAITGPVYETTAMSKFQRTAGADAVGMSTVPELIAGTHAGLDNLAISCITDKVRDNPEDALTHEEVVEVAQKVKPVFIDLMKRIVERL